MPGKPTAAAAGQLRGTDVLYFAGAVAITVSFGIGVRNGLPALRIPSAVLLTYLAPGVLLVRLTRPRVHWWQALTIGVALSVATMLITVLLLEVTGHATTATTLGWFFGVLTPVLAVADLAVRTLVPRRLVQVAAPSRAAHAAAATDPEESRWRPPVAVALCAAFSIGLAATAVGISVAGERPAATTALTQVGLVPVPGQARTFAFSITNRERRAVAYRIRVSAPGAAVVDRTENVAAGAVLAWEIRPNAAGTLIVMVFGGADTGFRQVQAVVL
jgi:hypothetical protein